MQQIFRFDVPINITLAPAGYFAEINGLLRADVQTSEALNTAVLPLRPTVGTSYVPRGTNSFAQATLDTFRRVTKKFFVKSFASAFPIVMNSAATLLEQFQRRMLLFVRNHFGKLRQFFFRQPITNFDAPIGRRVSERQIIRDQSQIPIPRRPQIFFGKQFVQSRERTTHIRHAARRHGKNISGVRQFQFANKILHGQRQTIIMHRKNETCFLSRTNKIFSTEHFGYRKNFCVQSRLQNSRRV